MANIMTLDIPKYFPDPIPSFLRYENILQLIYSLYAYINNIVQLLLPSLPNTESIHSSKSRPFEVCG
jgi:hypothetical protein